jgi:hypothetical protein
MGSTFFDTNLYPQGSMGGVPEPLRPKPGQLSLSQQRVYEVFNSAYLLKCLIRFRALKNTTYFNCFSLFILGLCSASLAKPV